MLIRKGDSHVRVGRFHGLLSGNNLLRTAFTLKLFATLALATGVPALSQTYTVLHNFTGGIDGANPQAGLTIDRGGNFYGTAAAGGNPNPDCYLYDQPGCGVVFRLQQRPSGWLFTTLYQFSGAADGFGPEAPVVFGPDGKLYGTTFLGGTNAGCFFFGTCGTVFSLQPRPTVCSTSNCSWILKTIYTFPGNPPPGLPSTGAVIFDNAGNLYGTFIWDGDPSCYEDGPCGGIYELSPANGGWNESTIVNFGHPTLVGAWPTGGIVMDQSGNLYGALSAIGAVYQASYRNGNWFTSVLHTFSFDAGGYSPQGGLIMDAVGSLYGTTSSGGLNDVGTVFELQPSAGAWAFSTLYNFAGNVQNNAGPNADLTMDAAGDLYGTTYKDGAFGYGSVFKLSPSNGQWTYTSLHDFTGGSDGGYPLSKVVFDSVGHLYGTANVGGSTVGQCNQGLGCGVVWEITP